MKFPDMPQETSLDEYIIFTTHYQADFAAGLTRTSSAGTERRSFCSSPLGTSFLNGILPVPSIGAKQRFNLPAHPRRHRALPVDRPGHHRAAIDMLDKPRELSRVALPQLACGHCFVQQLFRFVAKRVELLERNGMKIRIGQIVLQPGQAIGHRFRRRSKGSAVCVQLDERLQRRLVVRASRGELLRDASRRAAAQGQQQAALGAEALDQRGGYDTGLFSDVRKSELRGTESLHDARGSSEKLFVGRFARSR